MNYGLQVYNIDGTLMFDTSQGHQISRLHAAVGYSIASGGTVNINMPGIALDTTWAVLQIPTGVYNLVEITFSANTITLYCPGWCAGHSSSILVYKL